MPLNIDENRENKHAAAGGVFVWGIIISVQASILVCQTL